MRTGFMTGCCVVLATGAVHAANIALTASDVMGTSSFDGTGVTNWSNGQVPSAGNAYFTGAFFLRTPPLGGNYTFAGDSLSIDAGGGLSLKTSPGTITLANAALNGGKISNGQGAVTVAGNIDVTANSLFDTQTRSTTIAAAISGTNSILEISLSGGAAGSVGTVILSASNSFSGQWQINDASNSPGLKAILQLANTHAMQNGAVSLNMTTNDNCLLFSPGIGTFTLGGLSGNGSFGLTNTSGGAITLHVGYNNISTDYSGIISGSGSLTKIGTGTLTLSGANTYNGVTIVSNGTLGGIGMITGLVSVAGGGALSPGQDGAGMLTVGALTLANNATFVLNLGGTNTVDYNQLVVSTGSISLDDSLLSLSLTNGFKPVSGDSFTIIRNVPDIPVTGRFACGTSLRTSGIPGSFVVNYAGGAANDVVLQYQSEGTVVLIK